MNAAPIYRLLLGLSLLLVHGACADPDPEGRYEGFIEERGDVAEPEEDTTPTDTEGDTTTPPRCAGENWGAALGEGAPFFMSLRNPLDPSLLLYFNVSFTPQSGDEYQVTFQPLKTDVPAGGSDPRPDPRTPAGDPTIGSGTLQEDGYMELTLNDISVSGEANPLTGANITANLTMGICIYEIDAFCGRVIDGVAIASVTVPLRNQRFGAIRTADAAGATPMSECPPAQ